jgi:DNA-binding MarR family transcriptional regulator
MLKNKGKKFGKFEKLVRKYRRSKKQVLLFYLRKRLLDGKRTFYKHLEQFFGISKSTVSRIMDEFEEDNLIVKSINDTNPLEVSLTHNYGFRVAQKLLQELLLEKECAFSKVYIKFLTNQLKNNKIFGKILELIESFLE